MDLPHLMLFLSYYNTNFQLKYGVPDFNSAAAAVDAKIQPDFGGICIARPPGGAPSAMLTQLKSYMLSIGE
ncbi:hypothetical protein [uncultured Oscillibacter sp.]|jgi:hypothetical protein|uniref:hypothetical protein n=1 Tax=uncultured Oscillibacter sp. TaxID=876091 RepID=UPI0026E39CFA|nr:hypothetical protein [uncultured Oscillibacter sp.]